MVVGGWSFVDVCLGFCPRHEGDGVFERGRISFQVFFCLKWVWRAIQRWIMELCLKCGGGGGDLKLVKCFFFVECMYPPPHPPPSGSKTYLNKPYSRLKIGPKLENWFLISRKEHTRIGSIRFDMKMVSRYSVPSSHKKLVGQCYATISGSGIAK